MQAVVYTKIQVIDKKNARNRQKKPSHHQQMQVIDKKMQEIGKKSKSPSTNANRRQKMQVFERTV